MGKVKINRKVGSRKIESVQWFTDDGTRFTFTPDEFDENALRVHKFKDNPSSAIAIVPEESNVIIIK